MRMKHNLLNVTFILVAILFLGTLGMSAFFRKDKTKKSPDKDGHELTELWSDWNAAVQQDRPKREAEILAEIRKQAEKRRLAWDFYDASRKYVETVSSRNWKLRDSLENGFGNDVGKFDEPIVSFAYRAEQSGAEPDSLFDYVQANARHLKAGHNSAFYNRVQVSRYTGFSGINASFLKHFLANDYEYALWTLLPYTSLSKTGEGKIYEALKDYEGESYPLSAYLEYLAIPEDKDGNRQTLGLQAFVDKYAGKAISMWAKSDILKLRFAAMEKDKATSASYESFCKECEAFEEERKGFNGDEAKVVSELGYVRNVLLRNLTEKHIGLDVKDGKIIISLKNLKSVHLTMGLSGGKDFVIDKKLENGTGSFYLRDTLMVDIPELNDGDYMINAASGKDISNYITYSSARISLASRVDNRGVCIYAADYQTGEPIRSADIDLKKNGKPVVSCKGFVFDGFTQLPEDMAAKMKGDTYYTMECSFVGKDGFLRKSEELSIGRWSPEKVSSSSAGTRMQRRGEIFTDRGAYNPGDTVDFKVLIYFTDGINAAEVSPAGAKYKVVLVNAEGRDVESVDLITNDFGSMSGWFVLPEGERNGDFTIRVVTDSETAVSKSIRVDEFVLPTFDVAFDDIDKQYFPGDEVVVTGKVTSYSGHPVASGKAVYEVGTYGSNVASGPLEMGSDGTFRIGFKAVDEDYRVLYRVSVRITDDTGETHEYNRPVYVSGSMNVNAELVNAAEGNLELIRNEAPVASPWARRPRYEQAVILKGDVASVRFALNSMDSTPAPGKISYDVRNDSGKLVLQAEAKSGTTESIDVKSFASGLYTLKAYASAKSSSGREYTDSTTLKVLLVRENDKVLDAPVRNLAVPVNTEVREGEKAELLFGASDGAPVWALAEVFDGKSGLLETRMVRLSGARGGDGSLMRLSFDYKKEYPDAIRVQIFYFKDSKSVSCDFEYHRVYSERELPLSFSSFENRTWPASSYTFTVKTLPGVECLAAVYDKSSETIRRNYWRTFELPRPGTRVVYVNACPGSVSGGSPFDGDLVLDEESVVAYGASPKRFKTRAAMSPAMANLSVESAALEDRMDAGEPQESGDSGTMHDVRSEFANTLTFQPFLRSDDKGGISFTFNTSDKLSTYVVALYAHDAKMANAVLRREMMVTIPLKVNVVEPKYLYGTDKWNLSAAVSSVVEHDIRGTLTLRLFDGKDYEALKAAGTAPLLVKSKMVTVPAGKSVNAMFEVSVPELCDGGRLPENLGVSLVFVADKGDKVEFSDGMFVSIPVLAAGQRITESHSAVLLAGMDKDAVIAGLRNQFVNGSGNDAEVNVISIIDMIRDAVPSKVEPEGKDVLSLSEAMYVRELSYGLKALARTGSVAHDGMSDGELFSKVFACHNADGGFAWFEGMKSSPVITAVLLERFAKMLAGGCLDGTASVASDAASCADVNAVLSSAVRYLDKNQFASAGCPFWCGGISDEQYMYVRSMFSSVPFNVKLPAGKEVQERYSAFRKAAKAYLVPDEARGLNGYILAKVRRISILRNLSSSKDGLALAKSWGLGFKADKKLVKSVNADIVSLLEYAVDHKDGGVYYPNLVMPFRGLLESEAYAHSMVCDLLSGYAADASVNAASFGCKPLSSNDNVNVSEALRVADGIRLWLMLQKETQHWDSDPAFVDAVNSVMNGSPALKSTSVIVLSMSNSVDFSSVKASGNGFSVSRRFFREVFSASGDYVRKEISSGELLHVGDKIIAEYSIHNDENRSFVRLVVPREASLRPSNQLSGTYGWWMSPLRVNGWYSVVPQGYRNVKSAQTEYWFDSYPEENTTITEEFFVTQSGKFSAPVPVIESLYAPHYRANGAFGGVLVSE